MRVHFADASLPAVAMPIGEESRSKLWLKAKLTLKYIYVNHLDDADWFFKADDDTFAIVENLRRLVATYDPSKPYYLGRRLRYNDTSFLSGGAGYILSAEALRRVVEEGLGEQACPEHLPGFIDDVILGLCLHKIGAIFPDTRDDVGRQRFIPFDVEEFYKGIGDNITYLKEYDYYPLRLVSTRQLGNNNYFPFIVFIVFRGLIAVQTDPSASTMYRSIRPNFTNILFID